MASKPVVLRYVSDTKDLKRGFREAEAGAAQVEGVFGRMSTNVAGFSAKAFAQIAGVTAISAAVTSAARFAVAAISEQQQTLAQTEAVIRSTGGAANVSAKEFAGLAAGLAKVSGIDDDVVQGGENMLATFTNIRNEIGAGNDIFDQATKGALDMSVALGEDMVSSSMRLGKALNDPIAGVTALRRVGVLLTDSQKEQIRQFVATGDVMSAQKVILAEISKEFGGSAEAFGKTLPGALGRARTAAENWAASVAEDVLPAAEHLAETLGPPLLGAVNGAGKVLVAGGKLLIDHRGYVIALAAAYTATLIPALVRSTAALAVATWAQVANAIGIVILRVQLTVLALTGLEISALAAGAALAGVGVVAVVGLGLVISSFIKGKAAAKEWRTELEKGVDTSSFDSILAGAQKANAEQAELAERIQNSNNLITKKSKLLPALKEAADASADYTAMLHNVNTAVGVLGDRFDITRSQVLAFAKAQGVDLTKASDEVITGLADQYQAALDAAKGFGVYGLSLEDAAAVQKKLSDAFIDAFDATNVYKTGLTDANDAITISNKAAMDALEERHKVERDAVEETLKATVLFGDKTLAYQYLSSDKQKELKDQALVDLDTRQRAEKAAAEAAQANTKKATLGMEEYRRLVEANNKAQKEWVKNLAVIGSRQGGGAIVALLAELGPEAAGLVAEVAKSSKPEFDKFVGTMADSSETAVDAVKAKFGNLPEVVAEIARNAGAKGADALMRSFASGRVDLETFLQTRANWLLGSSEGAPILPGSMPNLLPRAEGHVAQVAPAGSWRVWAEPETGGEAYIPLALSKRGRSTALLGQVASSFGYGLTRMAAGGMWGVPAGGAGYDSRRGGGGARQVQMTNVFNEKADPLHIARKIAWQVN